MNSNPIGVFDSGVGGLSVLRHLVRLLPNEEYIYLGDTARVPYGNKSEETIIEYTEQAVRFLLQKGAKLIVIACNTASALALKQAELLSPVPVIGMIIPASHAAVRLTQNGKIGVIGTRATMNSNAYPTTIQHLSEKTLIVFSNPCPLFVPLAEEGFHNHPAAQLIASEYLAGFHTTNVDTLVMGCTHYPLLTSLIAHELPEVRLIDCGEYAAIEAERLLNYDRNEPMIHQYSSPQITFFLTDTTTTFLEIAERFLGFSVSLPERISLEHFGNTGNSI
ncbi:MAG: glutamate racemase [Ignavibacteria bacterium]|nr:glutamate racemase [Ignavibacteria bacterium]